MGAETKIQWCHFTFNPWIGCAKVSLGCKHCYAEVQTYPRVSKAHGLPLWGVDAARHVTSTWNDPRRWNREAAAAGERRRVFCASLADVFEARDDLDEHRARLWALIEETPALDWLLLTKRPEQIMQRIPERWREGLPANVWIGTTVEDQARADERIPHLLRVPARVRFLSCEPLLDRVDLRGYIEPNVIERSAGALRRGRYIDDAAKRARVNWIIVGGESGPQARPFDLAWARDLVQQCRRAHVPVFVKQLGDNPSQSADDAERFGSISAARAKKGGDPAEWPPDLRVREFPRMEAA